MAELVNNKRLIKANVDMSMPTLAESFRVQEDLTVDGATILTGPLTVTDTSLVVGLNADMVDGHNAGNASGDIPISNGSLCTNLNADMVDGYNAGNASGNIPISNGTVNTNLNADTVDGKHVGSSGNTIPLLDQANTVSGVQTFTARPAFNGGTSGSSSPFTVDSTQVVSNLNADLLDGKHVGSSGNTIPLLDQANTVSGANTFSGIQTFTANPKISNTAPYITFIDTTSDAYDFRIRADANVMKLDIDSGSDGTFETVNPISSVYTGSSNNLVDYPIGTCLLVSSHDGDIARNASDAIKYYTGHVYGFGTHSATGTPLSGTWRARGCVSGFPIIFQRTA